MWASSNTPRVAQRRNNEERENGKGLIARTQVARDRGLDSRNGTPVQVRTPACVVCVCVFFKKNQAGSQGKLDWGTKNASDPEKYWGC